MRLTNDPHEASWAQCAALSLLMLILVAAAGCGGAEQREQAVKEAQYHYQIGANHFEAGEVPQALRELEIALRHDADHAEALHLTGFLYMGRRQYLEAVRHFKRALEVRPDYANCQNNLGVAYLHMERWDDAAPIFEALIQNTLYTSPWLAYNNLGWAYYKMGRVADAIEQTRNAIFHNPEMCLAYNNLGLMYGEEGMYERAHEAFDEAIARCADYAEPHLHLGRLLVDAGQLEQAQGHFDVCVELSPRSHIGERCQQYTLALR